MYIKKVNSEACHLGSFLLSHSKRLMNDVTLALFMIKKYVLWRYRLRIDICSDDFEIMKTTGLIKKNLYQSKNGYGKGVFLFGLFLATKIKYCIVNDENVEISQKKQPSKDMIRIWWD